MKKDTKAGNIKDKQSFLGKNPKKIRHGINQERNHFVNS